MHRVGEWMLSYRYMTMEMEGLMKESSSITKAEGAALYPASMMGNMLPKRHDYGHAHVRYNVCHFQ